MYPHGFSKWNRNQKIEYITKHYLHSTLQAYKGTVDLSENVIGSIDFPFSVVPGFIVNNKEYCLPLVTEESSVVAALAKSAKYYTFYGEVLSKVKYGHIHLYSKDVNALKNIVKSRELPESILPKVNRMNERGGGIKDIEVIEKFNIDKDYYQIQFSFDTCEAMGANFINTVLEEYAKFLEERTSVSIIMAIMSNYTPDALVRVYLDLNSDDEKIKKQLIFVMNLAKHDFFRATTNNKGICNGIDALCMATGNDFRAMEATIHAYASRNGKYQGLTDYQEINGKLRISLTIPINVGILGGLVGHHPMTKMGFDLLQNPSINEFRLIVAAVGLAQNFAALKAIITEGIQKGHMRLHNNIINAPQKNYG